MYLPRTDVEVDLLIISSLSAFLDRFTKYPSLFSPFALPSSHFATSPYPTLLPKVVPLIVKVNNSLGYTKFAGRFRGRTDIYTVSTTCPLISSPI